jgi:polyhydroxyalkanoate synthase
MNFCARQSREKTVLHYGGDIGVALQHVGPLVGRQAHRLLWPRIVDWMAKTWTC